jgi:hypothetical protein
VWNDPAGCQVPDSPEQGGAWSHDYPMSLQALMKAFAKVTKAQVDSFAALTVTDNAFVKYPIAMLTEPGCWKPTEAEANALRTYLEKGGLLFLDDLTMADAAPEHLDLTITRTEAWMKRVLPTGRLVPVPASDSLFNTPFKIDPTNLPVFRSPMQIMGIYKDNDPTKTLMVIATYRGSLGHSWRHGSGPDDVNTPKGQAYRLGVNILHYGLSY